MKKAFWLKYRDLYEKFPQSRFAGVYTMHSPTVMIRDPELIKLVLVKDFSYFYDRTIPISEHVEPMSKNLFTMMGNKANKFKSRRFSLVMIFFFNQPLGDEWKNLRIKLTSTFTGRKMKMMFPLMKKCAEEIKPALLKQCQDGVDFDAKDICARFTTDVIGSCAFGIDVNSLQNPESEFRKIGKRIFETR